MATQMTTWIIRSGGNGSGKDLTGCRIVVTQVGTTITYQFLPPVSIGSGSLGSTSTSPPTINGITFKKKTWSVDSTTTPPLNPSPGTTWSGECSSNSAVPESDPGTWTAEATGSGVGGKGKGVKGASKKSAGKKSAKGASKKGTKSTKGTSKKGTKSAKGTRGRGSR